MCHFVFLLFFYVSLMFLKQFHFVVLVISFSAQEFIGPIKLLFNELRFLFLGRLSCRATAANTQQLQLSLTSAIQSVQ